LQLHEELFEHMSSSPLPVTISTEYKDVSLLLSALMRGIKTTTSFSTVALGAFGLSYSAFPEEVEVLLSCLQDRILAVNAQSNPIAGDAEAVGFAAHVLNKLVGHLIRRPPFLNLGLSAPNGTLGVSTRAA
jgi:hypothetical protein